MDDPITEAEEAPDLDLFTGADDTLEEAMEDALEGGRDNFSLWETLEGGLDVDLLDFTEEGGLLQ